MDKIDGDSSWVSRSMLLPYILGSYLEIYAERFIKFSPSDITYTGNQVQIYAHSELNQIRQHPRSLLLYTLSVIVIDR
jgi:hypothetical protein